MNLDELIETYYRLAYSPTEMRQVRLSPDLPREMLVLDTTDSNGWTEWRLLPRLKGIDPGFAELEAELGIALPYSFKLWHSRYYTLDDWVGIVRLESAPLNNPLGPLRRLIFDSWFPERILGLGLIPFGGERNDAGPLCFDTRQPRDDADWPIVFWDHEWNIEWLGLDLQEVSPVIFSSFTKLLECCIHYLDVPPNEHPEDERIAGFFEIDPEGAGGPGRKYYWEHFLEDYGE